MGQSSLILVLMATLTVGILLYNVQTVTTRSDSALSVKQEEALARETALVGLDRVVRDLVHRPDEWAQTATFAIPATSYDDYAGATYEVEVHNYRPGTVTAPGLPTIDDTLDVHVVGRYNDRAYTVKATYTKGTTSIGVPPALRNAIVTDEILVGHGANYIASTVDGQNANIHANDALSLNGSPVQFVIEGYGSYSGPSSSTGRVTFDPQQQMRDDGQTVFQADPIYIPPVDVTDALSRADVVTTPPGGTHVLSSQTIDLTNGWQGVSGKGTPDDPLVWYVNGNLAVSGEVFLLGHVEIIVNGNVTISGNSKLSPVTGSGSGGSSGGGYEEDGDRDEDGDEDRDEDERGRGGPGQGGHDLPSKHWSADQIQDWTQNHLPNGSQLIVGAAGNVALNGTPTIIGQIVSNGNITMNGGGNRMVVGGIAARGDITMNGNAEIWHATPSDGVLPGFTYDVPTGVFLLDYLEWPEQPTLP